MDAEENIKFEVGGKEGVVMIRIDYFTFTYECRYDGESVPEMTFDVMDYKEKNYTCRIPTHKVINIKGKKVAVFKIEMYLEGKREVFRKRYRDFAVFDEYLRGSFEGHHLLQNLPRLPPKQLKLFTDHFSAEFLQQRCQQLEDYVNKLVLIPKVVANPDFIRFLTKSKSGSTDSSQDSKQQRARSSGGGDNSRISRSESSELKKKVKDKTSKSRRSTSNVSKVSGSSAEGVVEIHFDDDEEDNSL
eukprot:CAMPEP_0197514992 /NCGR_PEP_ID=MMETSP1318-20131121/260_1 /TAXON_ID=552666 /ORGANISM="Partenskyella glossopodia, Strain RCC365" /LENGTH=244 /DNA_ID=CAMNT_0043063235 /DNA_START=153 /DNA_END=887 /DNA_ORIENTATION=+